MDQKQQGADSKICTFSPHFVEKSQQVKDANRLNLSATTFKSSFRKVQLQGGGGGGVLNGVAPMSEIIMKTSSTCTFTSFGDMKINTV